MVMPASSGGRDRSSIELPHHDDIKKRLLPSSRERLKVFALAMR
jgi:hypothetical protein